MTYDLDALRQATDRLKNEVELHKALGSVDDRSRQFIADIETVLVALANRGTAQGAVRREGQPPVGDEMPENDMAPLNIPDEASEVLASRVPERALPDEGSTVRRTVRSRT